jgi:hypothetical protein
LTTVGTFSAAAFDQRVDGACPLCWRHVPPSAAWPVRRTRNVRQPDVPLEQE